MLLVLDHLKRPLIPLSAMILSLVAFGNAQELPDVDETTIESAAASHLTESLLRVTSIVIQSNPLDVKALNTSIALVELAAESTPNNPDVWRAWIEVSNLTDRWEMQQVATKELLRLFPDETPLQLARLRGVVDSMNTAQARLNLYEQLLSPAGQEKLHYTVAARLAFDAAMLQRQLGNHKQFARWIAESVALDPHYTDGMAVAAGFFGDESASAYRRVELLTALMLANMRDVTTQVSLAELLMSFGSYEAASRVYDIALAENAGNMHAMSNDLLSDVVMCHWANRDINTAMEIIDKRQRNADDLFRKNLRTQEVRYTPLQLARIHAPLDPKLATVKAVMLADGDATEAADALSRAMESFSVKISIISSQSQTEEQIATVAEMWLQAAWVSLWIGERIDDSLELIENAKATTEISQENMENIHAWVSLRSGNLEHAEQYFDSIDGKSDSSIAGLAMVRLRQGKQQEAARLFLKLAKESAGTLLGIWSRNQLEKLLGQTIVARDEAGELELLIRDIPRTIDAYAVNPTAALTIRVQPVSQSVGPYEPILVRIELSNNGVLPMQISQSGPIQPLVLLEVGVVVVNAKIRTPTPIIIPIDRKLILKPRERFTVTADLRKHWVGTVFNEWPTRGGMLNMYAMSNFVAKETVRLDGSIELVYKPSLLGSKSKKIHMRVDGVRFTDLWLEQAISQVKKMETPEDLVSYVLLTWLLGDDSTPQVVEPMIPPPPGEEVALVVEGERHPLQDEAITELLLAFPSLGVHSKAWILSAMSKDPSFDSLVTMGDVGGNELTTIGWLLRFVSHQVEDTALDNALFIAATLHENPRVQTVAKWIYGWVENMVSQRLEAELGIPTELEDSQRQ